MVVIPANAGIQSTAERRDTRFRGYDEWGGFCPEKDKIYRETVLAADNDMRKGNDINRHAGKITLTQDPLEFQDAMRNEWT